MATATLPCDTCYQPMLVFSGPFEDLLRRQCMTCAAVERQINQLTKEER